MSLRPPQTAPVGATPAILYLGRFPRDLVDRQTLAGVLRFAAARSWRVRVESWEDAVSGALAAAWTAPDVVGSIVECGDSTPAFPPGAYGGRPAVFVNCPAPPRGGRFCGLAVDNAGVAKLAFRELALSRPPAFAAVGYWRGSRHWSETRRRAFVRSAAATGAKRFSFGFRGGDPRRVAVEDAARLGRWLLRLPRGTAVFAVNDETAGVVAAAAAEAGLRMPHDLALLGVDNIASICEKAKPTISSVEMDFENQGFQAAKKLEALVSGRRAAGNGGGGFSFGPLMVVRRESTAGTGRREKHVMEAIAAIRKEACSGLTVRGLLSRFPESRRLFELRFREATGHSVLDEIIQVRMESVKTMLASTDAEIGAVANLCGFGTDRAMRKMFRQREGVSPRTWRLWHRGR